MQIPPETQVVIDFDDNRAASALVGPYGQNLAQIERRLGVLVDSRGNHITIAGSRDGCEAGRRVLEALYAQAAQGRIGDGVALLCNALEMAPMSVELLSDVGALLLAAGQLREAALYAHRAVELSPQHAPSLYTLGFALSGLGEVKAAIEVLSILNEGQALDMLRRDSPELMAIVDSELLRLQAA